ncbi:MAG TPA: universal stress protein [Solirubrobacteraceae bacterium]|nr:universal stress protein [Solirubrobacteraceae bacterium]
MFSQVLVGVDDDHGARDAIALAKLLAGRDAALTFAHIFFEDSAAAWAFEGGQDRAEQDAEARQMLERVTAEAGVPAHLRWDGAPSVGRGLHEVAEAIGADLLVVGSSRHGLLRRVRLADDTQAALNGAACAVAIAPAGYATEATGVTREVGVAYDGTPESEHALAVARALAAELGSKLSAFQAVGLPLFGYSGLSTTRPAARTIEQMTEQAREAITALGVEAHVTYGDPAEELTVYSASIDLLVVGSRNYGPLGRLMQGSVADRLARTARCPLLVLPRGARAGSGEPESEGSPDAVAAAG